jgi:hypothetical protein
MRKFDKKIVQLWGKAVHNICTSCGQLPALCTAFFSLASAAVHKPRTYTSRYTRLIQSFIPAIFSHLSSVKGSVIPTIHTNYK